ncbi:Protein DNA-DAMAGE INDUCIBLE 1 [Camellia lanceoleosa]|uniref:Protein DNA-DAMAGE INDUCIBLE 1 n=1 Tax=Camellia lanceoleosa TaxID=1840588 RepID=A0ACC0FCV5_9ERIC|nr:Protein DNA-DAMAGE INDUCIBLE 1 [Camellia lanceoleosa]
MFHLKCTTSSPNPIVATTCLLAQVSIQQQQLFYNGKEMRNAEKLSGLGVNDGDLVMIVSHASSFRLRKWDQVQLPYPCHIPAIFLHVGSSCIDDINDYGFMCRLCFQFFLQCLLDLEAQ